MGSCYFQNQVKGTTDPATAFAYAKKKAQHDHGHAGYSGSIAEKDGYVEYEVPAGVSVKDLLDALCEGGDWVAYDEDTDDGDDHLDPKSKLASWYGVDRARRLLGDFDDKWGPAVAFCRPGSLDRWIFCGYASC